jgi:thiol-disulfide isomerase/thioredoxin
MLPVFRTRLFLSLAALASLTIAAGAWAWNVKETHAMTAEASAQADKKNDKKDDKNPFPRRIQLPADVLDGGTAWINTAGPMPLPKLRGKIVLLDFWTFCCINCIHVIEELEKLEHEFPNELVVIGVHSPKFPGEQDSENIKSAVVRYGLKHPVVNDAKMKIWRAFGARSWPTLVLIDPQGGGVRMYSGEGNYEQIRGDINRLIAYHDSKKTLDRTPLYVHTEDTAMADTPLRFPGKVIVDAKNNRMAVADSSHHRVVLADLTGKVTEVYGDGTPGLVDGDQKTVRFNDPQGMAFDGGYLWVADRKSHALRRIDLKEKSTVTIAGTGKRGYDRNPSGSGKAIALASPWDLLIVDGVMYIASAGTHQIWSMKMSEPGAVRNFAGTGQEDILDGPRLQANFAQPSGLASDGECLYVADSETSSIRAVGIKKDEVNTFVGRGLFEFGDKDGPGAKASLQHALGVAIHNGILYVADTYNNKLKTIDAKGVVKSWIGDGKPGRADQPARFDEPGGIHLSNGKLYVADTNNHLIRVVDIATKKVSTLELNGLKPPAVVEKETWPEGVITAALKLGKPTAETTLKAAVEPPKGTKLNKEAPSRLSVWKLDAKGGTIAVASKTIPPGTADLTAAFPASAFDGAASVRVLATIFPCEKGSEGVCRITHQAWDLVFDSAAKPSETVELK